MKKSILSLIAVSLPMSLSAQLVINEVLFDPAPGNDVNGDGSASTSQDEFVEIVNTGASSVNIGGYFVTDLSGNTFTFPDPTNLGANEAVLVFGGGSPAATLNAAAVFVGAPSLNNSADTITLFDANSNQVDQVAWTDGGVASDQSYNRSPEFSGDFVAFTTIPDAVGTESPGTDVTGNPFGVPLPLLALSPGVSSISESGDPSTVTMTVTLPEAPASYPATVTLTSNDLSEATVPASILIGVGLTGTFDVTGVDDTDPDGDREVTITASSDGFRAATATVTVTDDGDVGTESTSPILITQYYEGSSNNKYIELTNVSDAPVNLIDYTITRWSNASTEDFKVGGSLPGGQETLFGMLPSGASFVIANAGAVTPISSGSANVTSGVTSFNGDDSIVLYEGGLIDPANIADAVSFTDDGNEGAETGFVRLNKFIGFSLDSGSNVTDFETVWGTVATADVDAAALGDDQYLGSSSLGVNSPLLVFQTTSAIVGEADGTFELEVQILNPDGNAVSVDVVLNEGSSTVSPADLGNYTTQTVSFPAGAVSGAIQTVTLTLTDDPAEEISENAIFELTNLVTTGAAITGGASRFNLSLQDNDTVIPPLYISEISDPQDNPNARFVELFNPSAEEIDLALGNWNLIVYINGSSSGTSIPLVGRIPAGGTYLIVTDSDNFLAAYPSAPYPGDLSLGQENNSVNSNGNESFELRFGGGQGVGALADVYGVPATDGVGQDWNFADSRIERIVGAPNPVFTIGDWTITPATASDMTPGVHEGGVIIGNAGLQILGFSIDFTQNRGTLIAKGLGSKVWVLQSSDDLGLADTWETRDINLAPLDNDDGSTSLSFSDTFSANPKRFYRLIEQQ